MADDDRDFFDDESWGDYDDESLAPPPESTDFVDDDAVTTRDILDALGIDRFEEIVINFDKIEDPSEVRGNRFATIEEAVFFLYDIGVIAFSQVVFFEDEELFGVQIDNDTGGTAK